MLPDFRRAVLFGKLPVFALCPSGNSNVWMNEYGAQVE
jgi:hypothetical protein